MEAVGCMLSENQFLCSICLEVFTDPVTTPCGHSFCKTCINKHWDTSTRCQCPVCKEQFKSRPQLKVNTCLSELVGQFRNKSQNEEVLVSEPQSSEADVLCDVCSGPKLKALRSCLVCLLSYCQTHLQPHLTVPRLKKHQLIAPVENLEDRVCSKHDRPMELFCRDDCVFICVECSYEEHEHHTTAPLNKECEVKQAEIKDAIVPMIEERRERVEEIRRSVELSQKLAERELGEGVRIFNDLMKYIEQSLEQFKQSIEEKLKNTAEEAEELMEKIQREICVLEQSRAEMESLWKTGNHFYFLQTFGSFKPAPSAQDWSKATLTVPSYRWTAARAVSELHDEIFNLQTKLFETELRKVQQYAVDVTLDPDTAHPILVLSEDLKQVHYSDQENNLPETPQRFSSCFCVLGKQKFSSGQFYFEVQVNRKNAWILGVTKESGDRKIESDPSIQDGYWYIWYKDDQFKTSEDLYNPLSLRSSPKKVGVFVDYEEGLVCFYDVDSAEIIHFFTNCGFTENILPLFNPCSNDWVKSAPLVITSVTK